MPILSIDPGLNNCGLCVCEKIDYYHVLYSDTIKNNRKFNDEEKIIEEKYNSKTVKVLAILKEIEKVLTFYSIDLVVIEAPFFNSLSPMAYSSLLEVCHAIKYKIIIPNNKTLLFMEPLLIKKLFTEKAQANKLLMKEFLKKKKEFHEIVLPKDSSQLTEHEIDAIAIGFVYFNEKEKSL